MTGWAQRRFWSEVTVVEEADGVTVHLDGRRLRTPAKAPLCLPSRGLAEAVAEEWAGQGDRVDPAAMPFTRLANSAIDKVTPQFEEVADSLAAYGGSDLLCYRADSPAELVARQRAAWDPLLDWASEALGAPLRADAGIMHVPQPEDSLARLRAQVHALGPFELAAFHDLVALSGSLVLAFAVTARHVEPAQAWTWSRIDEDWQAEQWGADAEAEAVAARKRADFLRAAHAFALVRDIRR